VRSSSSFMAMKASALLFAGLVLAMEELTTANACGVCVDLPSVPYYDPQTGTWLSFDAGSQCSWVSSPLLCMPIPFMPNECIPEGSMACAFLYWLSG
jgi:hypothetical protein